MILQLKGPRQECPLDFLAICSKITVAEFWYVSFFLLENITLKQHMQKKNSVFPVASFEDLLLNKKNKQNLCFLWTIIIVKWCFFSCKLLVVLAIKIVLIL